MTFTSMTEKELANMSYKELQAYMEKLEKELDTVRWLLSHQKKKIG